MKGRTKVAGGEGGRGLNDILFGTPRGGLSGDGASVGVRFGVEGGGPSGDVSVDGSRPGGCAAGLDGPLEGGMGRCLLVGGFTPELAAREACLRATLAGPCELHAGRWFPAGTPKSVLAAHLREERRRLGKNRRQRERNRRRREADAREARIAELPPAVQMRLYGRTPVTTREDGVLRKVDYDSLFRSALGPHDAPFVPVGVKRFVARALEGIASAARRISAHGGREAEAPREEPGYVPPEVERTCRMRMERRKANRRATVADCPTPTDLRVAWEMRRAWAGGMLRLGALLLDLECFVDNSIVRREVRNGAGDGKSPQWEIVARRGGVRRWIAENCPELARRYKTLMRYKSAAAGLRQALDVLDPVPLSALFDPGADARRLGSADVHEQPRQCPDGDPDGRLPWERRPWERDANDRCFRRHSRYCGAFRRLPSPERLDAQLDEARAALTRLLSPTTGGAGRVYVVRANGTWNMSVATSRVDSALARREAWWAERPFPPLDGGVGE